jgi:hypothetical protein
MHSQLGERARPAHHLRELGIAQALPGHQPEHLTIVGTQPLPSGGKRREVGRQRVAPNRRQRLQLKGETLAQSAIALLAAPLVRQLAVGDAVEPELRLVSRRQLLETSPSREKRLRDQVGGILRSRRTAQRVAQDPWIGGLVEQAELFSALRFFHERPRCVAELAARPPRCSVASWAPDGESQFSPTSSMSNRAGYL